MNALTSIKKNSINITFPGIVADLRARVENHLREVAVQFLSQKKPSKTREQCDKEIPRLAKECLRDYEQGIEVEFQRTLRIPDDGKAYPLPPSLGNFPLEHVDDYPEKLPRSWRDRGGVMFPMHQSEALWLNFSGCYPAALKIATGKICAVSGEQWDEGLRQNQQNYCALPNQPWLDGYAVEGGFIRQFVAQPLGAGLTVEEQLTGEAEWGGIQLQAYPLNPGVFWRDLLKDVVMEAWEGWLEPHAKVLRSRFRSLALGSADEVVFEESPAAGAAMGLAPGGRMKQDIYEDSYSVSDYVECERNRCFVHLCNSQHWELITGSPPPAKPPTAKEYSNYGLPWFDYYDEKHSPLPGAEKLQGIQSVSELEEATGKKVLPSEPDEAQPKVIVTYIKD